MFVSNHTENFVRLCVKEHYRTVKYPDYNKWGLTEVQRQKADREMEEDVIKILFRIEHCNDSDLPPAHAIAEIIDKSIGSNFCKKRPADESIHDLVSRHNTEEG